MDFNNLVRRNAPHISRHGRVVGHCGVNLVLTVINCTVVWSDVLLALSSSLEVVISSRYRDVAISLRFDLHLMQSVSVCTGQGPFPITKLEREFLL